MEVNQASSAVAKAATTYIESSQEYCFAFGWWIFNNWPTCMTKSEWAAWAQAVLSVVSIVFATLFPMIRDHRKKRKEIAQVIYNKHRLSHNISMYSFLSRKLKSALKNVESYKHAQILVSNFWGNLSNYPMLAGDVLQAFERVDDEYGTGFALVDELRIFWKECEKFKLILEKDIEENSNAARVNTDYAREFSENLYKFNMSRLMRAYAEFDKKIEEKYGKN